MHIMAGNLIARSVHDLTAAAWFGGSLMGAVGLNGATSEAKDPKERLRLSSDGWARWVPWEVAAVAAHTIGGIGVIAGNRRRLKKQRGAGAATVVKLLVTVAAAGVTAYAGALGAKVKQHENEGAAGAVKPGKKSSAELASAQQQLKLAQWAMPALTGVALILNALHGEQQRGLPGALDSSLRNKLH
jgi:hypothetical protein